LTAPARLTAETARERIAVRSDLNAFISLSRESGHGPVVAVKDLVDVHGMVTTNGGPADDLSAASKDAAAVGNLRDVDVVVIGKTNLYEWAYGVSSVNANYGTVPNPRDCRRSAGGSSSGSAAAVAVGLCDWAIGSDTAGSVRIPASLCGIVGFKPSYGLVSMVGVTPLSPSQDTLGILAPSVRAAAEGVALMAGRNLSDGDPRPATPPLRLAVPQGWVDRLDGPTKNAWETLAHLPQIAFPNRLALFDAGRVIQSYEAARVHARELERSPKRYGAVVRERLTAGLTISQATYEEARDELASLSAGVDSALSGWDALVTPTTAAVAPPLNQEQREPLTRFTRPFSATGHPAITIPAAVHGLPVGIQLIGRRDRDTELLRVAADLERLFQGSVTTSKAPI
jgi:Asp-tRNA(Asn)/Glu-tRNA(Gln) amidotransferase A subunit family amidase